MTGIERLRQMAEDFKNVKTAEHCTFIVNTWRGRYIDDAIADIADQIEREQGEDADAIAWVRKHGGIESVKAKQRESMLRAAYERKKAGFLGHIAECETALRRRNQRIEELGHRVSDLTRENAELRKRAMPEGMCWPVFEDGKPVRIGDEISWRDEGGVVNSVELQDGGYFILHAADVLDMALSYGITAGLLWLVCLCFGWEWWSWQVALGVWLVLVILKANFGRSDK